MPSPGPDDQDLLRTSHEVQHDDPVTTPEERPAFSAMRLRGGRYDTPGFPLEALPELARYERLVLDVARALWKQAHPDRSRLPKGFAEQLQLRLTDVKGGSVVPVLERGTPPGQTTGPLMDDVGGLFEDARDLIEETFAAITANLEMPAALPPEALTGFVRFGSTLREHERIEFRAGSAAPIVYSQQVRRRLLARTAVERFQVEGLMGGRITRVDPEDHTFLVTTFDGRRLPGSYVDETVADDLLAVVNSQAKAPVVRVAGMLTVNAVDEVQGIDDVRSVEQFEVPEDEWGPRLMELAHLRSGWLDGEGEAVAFLALEVAREILSRADDLEHEAVTPTLSPTEDGGVLIEWASAARVVSIEIGPDLDIDMHRYAANGTSDLDERETVTIDGVLQWLRGALVGER